MRSSLLATVIAGAVGISSVATARDVVPVTLGPTQLRGSGVVVHQDWVLTAGNVVEGLTPSDVYVDGEQVTCIVFADGFNMSPPPPCESPVGNLALLRLASPTASIPYAVGDPSDTYAGEVATAEWWDVPGPFIASHPGAVTSNADLQAMIPFCIRDENIGLFDGGTMPVMRGGGGLFVGSTCVGIVSWGVSSPNFPVVFTRTSDYATWIQDTISTPPCCPAGTTTTKSFAVVGMGTGAAWEWAICSPTNAFADILGTYPGSTGTALDIANAFAGSINADACTTVSATAAPNYYPPGSAVLTVNVDDAFNLKVRPVGSMTWCTVTTLGMCSFNPDIQEILLSGFDCQNNGVDDIVDILTGTSVDTNVNAIPDECEGLTSDAPLGIAVTALGQAIIGTTIDGAMTVSNIGSSGLDGVSMDLGQAQGWEGTFRGPMVAADLPTGFRFTDEVIGSVNGVPGQTIMTTTIEDIGDVLEVTPQFMLPGVTSYTIEVYDGSELVASFPNHTGPAYTIPATSAHARGGYIRLPISDTRYKCYYGPNNPANFQIVGGPMVAGDRIEITAESQAAAVQYTSEIRRGGHTVGAGQVTEILERMAVQQFGQQHEATGAVMRGVPHPVTPDALALQVDHNIGTSLQDLAVLPNGHLSAAPPTQIEIDLMPVDLGTVDKKVMLRSRGSFGGTPDQDLGMAALLSTGPTVEVTADFAAIGTTNASVAVYSGGTFVDEVFLSTDSVLGTLTDMSGGTVAIDSVGKLSGAYPCFVIELPDPIIFMPPTNPFAGVAPLVGDEIRILAQNATAEVDNLESMTIGTDGIDTYTILAETFDVTDSCAADLDGSGDVGFADLTALLNAWGPCGGATCDADLDGSGDVGFADLTALLNAWGPCS